MWKNRYKSTCAAMLVSGILALSLPTESAPPAVSGDSQRLIARAVAAECPDASYGVQIALAAVILNRMTTPGFGDTAAQVIWGADFLTCTKTGRIAVPIPEPVYLQALSAVQHAAEGMDPTGGAIWYGGGDTGRSSSTVWYGDGGYLFWGE